MKASQLSHIVLCILCVMLPTIGLRAAADPLDTWTWRHPLPQGNDLEHITFANQMFFGMGAAGTLVTSTNGLDWSVQFIDATEELRDVAWGGGTYVALGRAGAIFSSPDAVHWTSRATGVLFGLNAVTFGNGVFLAVGPSGITLTSPNGFDWTLRTFAGPNLTDIAFHDGLFVMSASSGILISTDGIQWSLRLPSSVSFSLPQHIAYGNGRWVVSALNTGQLAVSADGNQWRQVHPGTDLAYLSVVFGGGNFLALGVNSSVAMSPDGFVWTEAVSFNPGDPLDVAHTIAWGAGLFVAAGSGGTLEASTNGTNWVSCATDSNPTNRAFLYHIAAGNGHLVALGDFSVLFSGGSSFGPLQPQLLITPEGQEPQFVTYAHDQFLVVGGANNETVFHSSDGTHWNPGEGLPVSGYIQDALHVGEDDYFVTALGVWRAEGGTNFVEVGGRGYGIGYGDGRFVVVDGNTTFVSEDGRIFSGTEHTEEMNLDLEKVAFGNGRFVAMGSSGVVGVSTNGDNWFFSNLGLPKIARVLWVAGRFIAVGDANSFGGAPGALLLSSGDGQAWTPHPIPLARGALSDAIVADGRLLLIGENGAMLQSGLLVPLLPRIDISLGHDGNLRLRVSGEPASSCRVEYRRGLGEADSWASLTNLVLPGSGEAWMDLPRTTTAPTGFYRAVKLN